MALTKITLLNSSHCYTEIPLDELYILYKQVVQKRATVVISAYWGQTQAALDIRRLDPDATFTPEMVTDQIAA